MVLGGGEKKQPLDPCGLNGLREEACWNLVVTAPGMGQGREKEKRSPHFST